MPAVYLKKVYRSVSNPLIECEITQLEKTVLDNIGNPDYLEFEEILKVEIVPDEN